MEVQCGHRQQVHPLSHGSKASHPEKFLLDEKLQFKWDCNKLERLEISRICPNYSYRESPQRRKQNQKKKKKETEEGKEGKKEVKDS